MQTQRLLQEIQGNSRSHSSMTAYCFKLRNRTEKNKRTCGGTNNTRFLCNLQHYYLHLFHFFFFLSKAFRCLVVQFADNRILRDFCNYCAEISNGKLWENGNIPKEQKQSSPWLIPALTQTLRKWTSLNGSNQDSRNMWKTDEEEEEASSTLTCADNQHTDQSPLFDSHHPLEHKLSAGLRNTESNIPATQRRKTRNTNT